MNAANPYAPPNAETHADFRISALGELVRSWEKLRLYYNASLLIPGIGVLALWSSFKELPIPAAVVGGILTGIGANVAFFLGPLAELYLRGLFRGGASIGRARLAIFAAGMLVSAGFFVLSAAVALL